MVKKILNYLPKLFTSLVKKYDDEEEKSKIIKYIIEFDKYIVSNDYKNVLSLFQNVIVMKMMALWENQGVQLSGQYNSCIKSYLKDLKKYEYGPNEKKIKIFNDIDVEKKEKENINEFFSSLIILFLKQKEKDNIKQVIELWEEIGLSYYVINDEIKEDLEEFLKTDEHCKVYYKELYEDNKLFELENSNILREIYDYINYKSAEKIEIEKIKDYADKERQYDDYGRNIQINETEPKKIEGNIIEEKIEPIPEDILNKVFKEWIIKIIIDLNNEPLFNYYYKNENDQTCDVQLYEKYDYDIKDKNYKNYKEYLNFREKVENFLNDNIKNNKKKGTIVLTLTSYKDDHRKENNVDSAQKNLFIVNCESYFEKEGTDGVDENFGIFIDRDVLIDGINGRNPGFIFLINELCNEDNKDDIKRDKKY